MALRNMPYRSEVLAWDPDSLADYFKKVSPVNLFVVRLTVPSVGFDSGVWEESKRRKS